MSERDIDMDMLAEYIRQHYTVTYRPWRLTGLRVELTRRGSMKNLRSEAEKQVDRVKAEAGRVWSRKYAAPVMVAVAVVCLLLGGATGWATRGGCETPVAVEATE